MPSTAKYALNIRLSGPEWEPPGYATATLEDRAWHWQNLGRIALRVKQGEVKAGFGADGKKLKKVKPSSRKDGAKGPPLVPHVEDSRTYRLLAVHVGDGFVTLYWKGHGRKSWSTILGYHAYKKGPRSLPVRNTIGISPKGRRAIRAESFRDWKARMDARAKAAAPKPGPKTRPRPAPLPKGAVVEAELKRGRLKGPGFIDTRALKSKPFPAPKPAPAPKPPAPKPAPSPPQKPPSKPAPTPKPPAPKPPKPVPVPGAPQVVPEPRPRAGEPIPPARPKSPVERAAAIARAAGVETEVITLDRSAEMIGASMAPQVPAFFSSKTLKIYISAEQKLWADPAASMAKSYASRWFSSPDPDHIVHHELGHALHLRHAGEAAYERVKKLRFTEKNRELVAAHVSRYGAEKPIEFVAEVYAGLKAGKSYNEDVMRLYRKLHGPLP